MSQSAMFAKSCDKQLDIIIIHSFQDIDSIFFLIFFLLLFIISFKLCKFVKIDIF